jgi:hypothetical protein
MSSKMTEGQERRDCAIDLLCRRKEFLRSRQGRLKKRARKDRRFSDGQARSGHDEVQKLQSARERESPRIGQQSEEREKGERLAKNFNRGR